MDGSPRRRARTRRQITRAASLPARSLQQRRSAQTLQAALHLPRSGLVQLVVPLRDRMPENSTRLLHREERAAMQLDDLRSLVEVVESGGFSRAAKRLGISKSMISRRIARMEADLGTPLLSR